MLSFDDSGLEDLKMEEQVHLTITATICGTVFAIIYYFSTLKESYIAHEVAMMRKSMGLKAGDAPSRRASAPPELGPHSYMTLLLSAGCCAAILLFIYLVKVTPFDSLAKMTPLHKLIQIVVNGGAIDDDDEGSGRRRRHLSQDTVSSRERVLETCMELEKRLVRLEQCLVPLLQSLDLLTQQADFQSVAAGPDNASSELSSANLNADPAAGAGAELESADTTDPPKLISNLRLRKLSVVNKPT